MQYIIFFALGILTWGVLFAARKWSLRKHHSQQHHAFNQGAPIAHLVSQATTTRSHHWVAVIVGIMISLGTSMGIWAAINVGGYTDLEWSGALVSTAGFCALIAIAHGLKRLPLPSPTYTLPEA